ncbi:MAG: DUF2752 domain-containing protein [Bacteroidales bacterium]|nr:DUF2752 domain-containing protein [Bacteroidales bacterium]
MATKKEYFQYALKICKLCGLILLPFLLSLVSLDKLDGKHSICLIKNLFGVECWGCGITKAVIAAVQLDFVRAFQYNKLIIIVMPLLVYLWIKQFIKLKL